MIKKFFLALALVVSAINLMAQSGATCNDPIPVDSTYRARIEGPCVVWYTAGTYDLPLNVHFVPDDPESTWGPEVQVDFTCIPGVYADPKIDSLINMVEAFDLEFPLEMLCDKAGTDEQVEWDLFVNSTYRDQLAEFGVTYNVQAFVRVEFFEPGLIRMQPDTVFANCMENAENVVLDQEIVIEPNDSSRVFVMPYTDWQNDSIQFVWNGNAPATIWLATGSCEFLPSMQSGYYSAHYVVQPGVPYRVSNKAINDLIKANTGGGLFYTKILSSENGTLLTEKIPMTDIQGGAILLEYGKTVHVPANATDMLFCFPKTWGPTMFEATTKKSVKMYLAHSADFDASSEDANVVATIPFGLEEGVRTSYLSTKELTTYMSGLTEDYMYVRFISEEPINITPDMWSASLCANQSTLIIPNVGYAIAARSGNTIFRIRYTDYEGYPFDIQWKGPGNLPVYISDTCHYVLSSSNVHVLKYLSIRSGKQSKVDSASLASWETSTEEGYLYVRFNPTNNGTITFLTNKPVTPAPIYTTIAESVCFGESYTWNGQTYSATGEYQQTFVAANGADSIVTLQLTVRPEVPATEEHVTVAYGETHTWNGVTYTESGSYSVTLQDAFGCDSVVTLHLTVLPNPNKTELYPNDYMILNLASAFKVFTMEHLSWVAQDVNIHWGGTSPLYVFIASENDFALTPYNRYVLHYEEIAAGGDWVLTAAQMASWAQHAAAAGGKVYVRFLTEFEGELTTKGL